MHGPTLLKNSAVVELILHPVIQWDTTLIDRLFLQYDAEAIKHIPLSDRAPADSVYWPGNPNGQYSVRSVSLSGSRGEQSTTWMLQP
jgi:hypothetical protein